MKLNISAIHSKEITTYRAQLAELLAKGNGSIQELARLTESRDRLTREISKLEDIDEPSDADAAQLVGKRTQLERVANKLHDLEGNEAVANAEFFMSAKPVLQAFARAAAAATGPTVQAYIEKIAAPLRPWCQTDAEALHLAGQTAAAVSLKQATTYPWGSYNATVKELQGAIRHANAILDGQLAWSFDSKK